MAVRKNGSDFQRDVAARTVSAPNQVTFVATLNSDNVSYSITRNGVAIFSKVYWNVQGSAGMTDASSPNQDTVTIADSGGALSPGSAQAFINSLV